MVLQLQNYPSKTSSKAIKSGLKPCFNCFRVFLIRRGQFRIWDKKGREFEEVNFINSLFEFANSQDFIDNSDLMFARQQIFGENNQKILNQLKVGLIGCGGIGSIFVELLGRLDQESSYVKRAYLYIWDIS